ncbi:MULTISPECIES: PTS glucose transporter subunit IIA [unclassified Thermoactinomyces]|uniref:PTS sugar transporter subunit IIA n=1 Tax=unclassified Thermoactinomyces TaxID=2634588 RepID=UPI0018DC0455|nr:MULTISPECIES: PTS glucose transporter subunit IIA [unclassified Thermoactinomyces]MBH8585944.1 PTS glucose transporter subunit IIA [Thermoactinomyces sp. CICC 10520]MBI0391334.1 PTS glucose transporter subunit IIA [Thermoactinomyces sp. CICC 24226]
MFFWKKKKKSIEVYSPMNGRFVSLYEVPDQVFSQGMMGEGFAVDPVGGEVVSPVDGKVIHVFPTKHAIGLKTADGLEILVHIGIDTVELNGEGFETFVSEGDSVKVGQKLLKVDVDFLKGKGKSPVSPVVFPQSAEWKIEFKEQEDLKAGETHVASVEKK